MEKKTNSMVPVNNPAAEFYAKKEIAHKIEKILAENNCSVAGAEGILEMVMKNIKLSSVVKCFDLEE